MRRYQACVTLNLFQGLSFQRQGNKALKQVQGDGSGIIEFRTPPLPLGEDTEPWPTGLGVVGEARDGEGVCVGCWGQSLKGQSP